MSNQHSAEAILNFTLKFGKFKGQQFKSTPQTYQKWLLQQEWFKLPTNELIPPIFRGEEQEWAYFEYEKKMAEKDDCRLGICSCCPDSQYYGI